MGDLVDVELDAVGKAAEAFLACKREKTEVAGKFKKAEAHLITELRKAKRNSISLKRQVLRVQIVSAREKITVMKGGR